MLENGTYFAPDHDEIITLVDGQWIDQEAGWHYGFVGLENIAFGDLDNDGIEDAAVTLRENMGGTLWTESVLVILNRDGIPVQSANREVYHWTGFVTGMMVLQGQIILEENLHDWDDPNCCPSLPAVETMQFLSEGHLVQRRFISIAEGERREIAIASPVEGTVVSCSIHVKGSVYHTPLDNLLYYSIRNLVEEELASGSFSINANGTNAGGTFDTSIDLSMVPAGEPILVYIYNVDYEHYDFLQALDSIFLLVI